MALLSLSLLTESGFLTHTFHSCLFSGRRHNGLMRLLPGTWKYLAVEVSLQREVLGAERVRGLSPPATLNDKIWASLFDSK